MLPTWFNMNKAQSLDAFKEAQAEYKGIPWVYTMATDKSGQNWFVDSSAVPHFSEEAIDAFFTTEMENNPFTSIFWKYNVIAVSGETDLFHWKEEDGARSPGLIPFSQAPQLQNSSYVFNANDSHWLSHATTPLEGYSFVYGSERAKEVPELA